MVFHAVTIFPELIRDYFNYGIISRAVDSGDIKVYTHQLRDYAENKYLKIDKPVFGHGKGMLFEPGPLQSVIKSIKKDHPRFPVIFLSPNGKKFDVNTAKRLSGEEGLILISARYEGIDSRIIDSLVDEVYTVGDYVLTGGELPLLIVMDAVSRFVGETVKAGSLEEESFENGLVEYDHYTEPVVFNGTEVPEVLRSGDHGQIERFRLESSLRNTYLNRPDLFGDFRIPLPDVKSRNELTRLKKQNKAREQYLFTIQKIAEEWKNGRRNGKE